MKVYCTLWPMYFLPVFFPCFVVIVASKWNIIIHPVLVEGEKMIVIILEQILLYSICVYGIYTDSCR